MRSLLTGLVITAILAFLAALVLHDQSAVLWRHVLFAAGVMPLILGAMLYFIPVLTRSPPATGALLLMPVAAFLLGASTVIAFRVKPEVVPFIGGLMLLVLAGEFIWAWRRRAQVFGSVHPGLDWYLAALAALMLALGLIASRVVWPEGWSSTRLIHLHLNLMGFLGMTAIGTLRVLLPTVMAVQDPSAQMFLRRYLPVVLAGTLAIAVGAAYWPPLSVLGALLWMWPGLSLLRMLRRYPRSAWSAQHAGLALGGAVIGWFLVLCAGIAHGLGLLSGDTLIAWLIYLFLLPLVTGASSYLLPVWRWPGRQSPAHTRMREQLMALSGVRIAAFGLSAVLVAVDYRYAFIPAALALLGYLLQVLSAFLRVHPPPAT